MKNLLTVVGDGNAGPVLDAAFMAARRFNSHIVGLHSLTTEYAVVFGGEMGFSISSEVDRTLEREGHERRDQARRLFRDFMTAKGVPLGPVPAGHNGPSASWREEDGRQNAVVGMIGRVYDLIVVEQPEKLASIAEATLEDALVRERPPGDDGAEAPPPTLGEVVAIAWNGSTETALTVALGMPFLKQAQQVVVVAVGPQHMPEPGPDRRRAGAHARAARPRCQPAHGHRPAEGAGRVVSEGSDGGRRRSAAEGRVHAEPHPPDDLRRRDPAHHHGSAAPGLDGALNPGPPNSGGLGTRWTIRTGSPIRSNRSIAC